MSNDPTTVAELLRARVADPHVALRFGEGSWTWHDHVRASATRAALALDLRRAGPFHIGYLLENVPELSFWLGAGMVAGATMVGINPTRRGAELEADIRHTDCQLVVTERAMLPLLDGLDLGVGTERILVVDDPAHVVRCESFATDALPDVTVSGDAAALLVFTSGTSGAPKAAIVSQARLARYGATLCPTHDITAESVVYLAMPLFHSGALYAGWAPAVHAGATMVLRRRFSASGFIDDVRRYGVTYFSYVGKPLSYIVATPERPDDSDNTLRRVVGNEGAPIDIERFSRRFAVPVVDNYGSTEGGIAVLRTAGQPAGALGRLPEGASVVDAATGLDCPPAHFDADGRLLNAERCIGEIVNAGTGSFEGYYKNPEAAQARVRNGRYWSGDLGYVDADGWLWFAGRDHDWLRVDGENFASAPVERIIHRHPDVVIAAVYAVPAPEVGDDVMAAIQLGPDATFDAGGFDAFLDAQRDLGTKWRPRYVRVAADLPVTATTKVLKRQLRAERWECADPVWWRPEPRGPLRRLRPHDVDRLRTAFVDRGRADVLEVR